MVIFRGLMNCHYSTAQGFSCDSTGVFVVVKHVVPVALHPLQFHTIFKSFFDDLSSTL
jgi:hypothetical protein